MLILFLTIKSFLKYEIAVIELKAVSFY